MVSGAVTTDATITHTAEGSNKNYLFLREAGTVVYGGVTQNSMASNTWSLPIPAGFSGYDLTVATLDLTTCKESNTYNSAGLWGLGLATLSWF